MTIPMLNAKREILPALLLLAAFAGLAFLGLGRGKERFLDKAERVPAPMTDREVRELLANGPNAAASRPAKHGLRVIPLQNVPEMGTDAVPGKPVRHYRIE